MIMMISLFINSEEGLKMKYLDLRFSIRPCRQSILSSPNFVLHVT